MQHEFGGRYESRQPTRGQIDRAAAVVRSLGEPTLYARVDMVDPVDEVDPVDSLRLLELELIEPVLFFTQDRESPRRFARALLRLLESPHSPV